MAPVSCAVCLETFDVYDKRPVVGQCGHSICLSCAGRLLKCNDGKCPTCMRSNAFSKFYFNYQMIEMLEVGTKTKRGKQLEKNKTGSMKDVEELRKTFGKVCLDNGDSKTQVNAGGGRKLNCGLRGSQQKDNGNVSQQVNPTKQNEYNPSGNRQAARPYSAPTPSTRHPPEPNLKRRPPQGANQVTRPLSNTVASGPRQGGNLGIRAENRRDSGPQNHHMTQPGGARSINRSAFKTAGFQHVGASVMNGGQRAAAGAQPPVQHSQKPSGQHSQILPNGRPPTARVNKMSLTPSNAIHRPGPKPGRPGFGQGGNGSGMKNNRGSSSAAQVAGRTTQNDRKSVTVVHNIHHHYC